MNGIIFFSNPNIGMEVAQRLFNLTSIPHP